jgi:hypothetical protein
MANDKWKFGYRALTKMYLLNLPNLPKGKSCTLISNKIGIGCFINLDCLLSAKSKNL